MARSDPRRSIDQVLHDTSPLDVLFVNPPSTFADAPPGILALPSNHLEMSSANGRRLAGDQDHEPNHGLLSIMARLRTSGLRYDLLDLNSIAYLSTMGLCDVDPTALTISILASRRPRVVAVSSMTPNLHLARKLSLAVREVLGEAVTIVLGGIATCSPEACFRDSEFDLLVVGEGEHVIGPLLMAILKGQTPTLPGVFSRASGLVPPLSPKLRGQPPGIVPAYDLLPRELPLIPRVFHSRGCGTRCGFCSPAAFFGNHVHVRSSTDVVGEIDYLHATFDFEQFLIGDLTLYTNLKQVRQTLEYLAAEGTGGWWCQTQVVQLTESSLHLLSKAGCSQVALGFEDFQSPDGPIRKKNRGRTRAIAVCETAKSLGLMTQSYWTFGLPEDTLTSSVQKIRDLCEFIRLGLMDTIHVSFLVPYPGTPYYDRRDEYQLVIDDDRYDEFIGSDGGYYNTMPMHSTRHLRDQEIFLLTRLAVSSCANEFFRLDSSIHSTSMFAT